MRSIRLDPQYTDAYFNRGVAYGDLGEYDRAIQDYDAVVRLDPEYTDAYHNRGFAYDVVGRASSGDRGL